MTTTYWDVLIAKTSMLRGMDDLTRLIGEVTPEEQAMLDATREPTEEELEESRRSDPDFEERMEQLTLDAVQRRERGEKPWDRFSPEVRQKALAELAKDFKLTRVPSTPEELHAMLDEQER